MKTALKSFILPVLVVVLGAWFVFLLKLNNAPDLRSSVTDAVPVASAASDSPSEQQYAQVITVENVGTVQSNNITVVVPRRVIGNSVTSHLPTVKEVVTKSGNSFSLVYPGLPPKARFQLNVTFVGLPTARTDVLIESEQGLVTEAPDKSGISWGVIVLAGQIGLLLWYISLVFQQLKENRFERYVRSARVRSAKQILKDRRPALLGEQDWPKAIGEALVQAVCSERRFDVLGEVERTSTFFVLDCDKPDNLDGEPWLRVREAATERYVEQFERKIQSCSDLLACAALYRAKRPLNLPKASWDLLIGLIARKIRLVALPSYISAATLEETIEQIESSPEEMPREVVKQIRDELSRLYVSQLVVDAVSHPFSIVLSDQAIGRVNGEMAKSLVSVRSLLIARRVLLKSPAQIREFIKSGAAAGVGEEWVSTLNSFLDSVDHVEQQKSYYSKSSEVLRLTQQRSDEAEQRMLIARQELDEMRRQVVQQLRLIHEAIADPTAVERVESFEGYFSKGNLQNLKTIAAVCAGRR